LTGQKGITSIVCLKEKNGFLTQNFRVWNGIFTIVVTFCIENTVITYKMFAKSVAWVNILVVVSNFLQKVFADHKKNNTFATCIEN
jgi:hypothetical protein